MAAASVDLTTALESELLGVASFRTAYYLTLNQDKKRKYRALWQLEQQTLEKIRDYFQAKGLEKTAGWSASLRGTLLGALVPLLSVKKMCELTLKETDHFLAVFRRLEAAADDEDKPLFSYVVAHELAIEQFAKRELEGLKDQSIDAVEALLEGS